MTGNKAMNWNTSRYFLLAAFAITSLAGQTIDPFNTRLDPAVANGRMSDPSGMAFGSPIQIAGAPGPVQNCLTGMIGPCRTARVVTTGYGTNGIPAPNYIAADVVDNGYSFNTYNIGNALGYSQLDYQISPLVLISTSKKLHFDAASQQSNPANAPNHPKACITATFILRGGSGSWTKTICQTLSGGAVLTTPVYFGYDIPVTAFLTPDAQGNYPALVYLSAFRVKVSIDSPNQVAYIKALEFRP